VTACLRRLVAGADALLSNLKLTARLMMVATLLAGAGVASGLAPARAAQAAEADQPAAAPGVESNGQPAGVAEGEAVEGERPPTIHAKSLLLQIFNFAVLLAILIKFGGGAINKALQARHHQLKTDLLAASEARAAAEGRLRKNDERLAGLEREIEAMRAGIKQEAEVEKARLVAAAEERAKRLREETAFVIDQQVKEAQAALRREVAEGAVRIAEQLLRRQVDAADQRRLLDGFVNDVAGAPPAAVEKAV
jgi:F-type H+-transporting ATPase subunit b